MAQKLRTGSKEAIKLFKSADLALWDEAKNRYKEAISLKADAISKKTPSDLIELDQWWKDDLGKVGPTRFSCNYCFLLRHSLFAA